MQKVISKLQNERKKVLVIPGDGIGVEVTEAALQVAADLKVPFDLEVQYEVNSKTYIRTGSAMPESVFEQLKLGRYSAILFGAIGDALAPVGAVERSLLLRLRTDLRLSLNIRPLKLPAGMQSPLVSGKRLDAVIVRENNEGIYTGGSGSINVGFADEVAVSSSITTLSAVSKAIGYSFDLGRRSRRSVTLVHKINAIRDEGRVWKRAFDEAARVNSDVVSSYLHADAAAMKFVSDPDDLGIVVTDNLFGDILSDLGAALSGGIGLAASQSLNIENGMALFEPVHGSAPDIAGRGLANPLAMIKCLGMCAAHLGSSEIGNRIANAVEEAAAGQSGLSDTKNYLEAVRRFLS